MSFSHIDAETSIKAALILAPLYFVSGLIFCVLSFVKSDRGCRNVWFSQGSMASYLCLVLFLEMIFTYIDPNHSSVAIRFFDWHGWQVVTLQMELMWLSFHPLVAHPPTKTKLYVVSSFVTVNTMSLMAFVFIAEMLSDETWAQRLIGVMHFTLVTDLVFACASLCFVVQNNIKNWRTSLMICHSETMENEEIHFWRLFESLVFVVTEVLLLSLISMQWCIYLGRNTKFLFWFLRGGQLFVLYILALTLPSNNLNSDHFGQSVRGDSDVVQAELRCCLRTSHPIEDGLATTMSVSDTTFVDDVLNSNTGSCAEQTTITVVGAKDTGKTSFIRLSLPKDESELAYSPEKILNNTEFYSRPRGYWDRNLPLVYNFWDTVGDERFLNETVEKIQEADVTVLMVSYLDLIVDGVIRAEFFEREHYDLKDDVDSCETSPPSPNPALNKVGVGLTDESETSFLQLSWHKQSSNMATDCPVPSIKFARQVHNELLIVEKDEPEKQHPVVLVITSSLSDDPEDLFLRARLKRKLASLKGECTPKRVAEALFPGEEEALKWMSSQCGNTTNSDVIIDRLVRAKRMVFVQSLVDDRVRRVSWENHSESSFPKNLSASHILEELQLERKFRSVTETARYLHFKKFLDDDGHLRDEHSVCHEIVHLSVKAHCEREVEKAKENSTSCFDCGNSCLLSFCSTKEMGDNLFLVRNVDVDVDEEREREREQEQDEDEDDEKEPEARLVRIGTLSPYTLGFRRSRTPSVSMVELTLNKTASVEIDRLCRDSPSENHREATFPMALLNFKRKVTTKTCLRIFLKLVVYIVWLSLSPFTVFFQAVFFWLYEGHFDDQWDWSCHWGSKFFITHPVFLDTLYPFFHHYAPHAKSLMLVRQHSHSLFHSFDKPIGSSVYWKYFWFQTGSEKMTRLFVAAFMFILFVFNVSNFQQPFTGDPFTQMEARGPMFIYFATIVLCAAWLAAEPNITPNPKRVLDEEGIRGFPIRFVHRTIRWDGTNKKYKLQIDIVETNLEVLIRRYRYSKFRFKQDFFYWLQMTLISFGSLLYALTPVCVRLWRGDSWAGHNVRSVIIGAFSNVTLMSFVQFGIWFAFFHHINQYYRVLQDLTDLMEPSEYEVRGDRTSHDMTVTVDDDPESISFCGVTSTDQDHKFRQRRVFEFSFLPFDDGTNNFQNLQSILHYRQYIIVMGMQTLAQVELVLAFVFVFMIGYAVVIMIEIMRSGYLKSPSHYGILVFQFLAAIWLFCFLYAGSKFDRLQRRQGEAFQKQRVLIWQQMNELDTSGCSVKDRRRKEALLRAIQDYQTLAQNSDIHPKFFSFRMSGLLFKGVIGTLITFFMTRVVLQVFV